MRNFIALAGALVLAACGTFGTDTPTLKAPLDNKTFKAQVARDGKSQQSQPAELIFEKGTFRSTSGDEYGFAFTRYTAVKEGDFMKFEAVAKAPDYGTMTWKGKVRGETIEGTAIWDPGWYKPDREYTFKGKLK